MGTTCLRPLQRGLPRLYLYHRLTPDRVGRIAGAPRALLPAKSAASAYGRESPHEDSVHGGGTGRLVAEVPHGVSLGMLVCTARVSISLSAAFGSCMHEGVGDGVGDTWPRELAVWPWAARRMLLCKNWVTHGGFWLLSLRYTLRPAPRELVLALAPDCHSAHRSGGCVAQVQSWVGATRPVRVYQVAHARRGPPSGATGTLARLA